MSNKSMGAHLIAKYAFKLSIGFFPGSRLGSLFCFASFKKSMLKIIRSTKSSSDVAAFVVVNRFSHTCTHTTPFDSLAQLNKTDTLAKTNGIDDAITEIRRIYIEQTQKNTRMRTRGMSFRLLLLTLFYIFFCSWFSLVL